MSPRQMSLVVVAALALGGCIRTHKQPLTFGPSSAGPHYSTVPCADNCGRDTACQASCTPASNQQHLPVGLRPLQ